MSTKRISEAVIRRLPRYYRHLEELKNRGVERISSNELAKEMGLNASQIRQDFNCFGGFGQQGYGYQVSTLHKEIASILGLTTRWNMVVVGAGNIGSALMGYAGFANEDYHILAAFDVSPSIIGREIHGVKVDDYANLPAFLERNEVQIGIISTQKEDAQAVCDVLVNGGVKGIWNYTPIDVDSEGAFVENVHLTDNLHVLSYRLHNNMEDLQKTSG